MAAPSPSRSTSWTTTTFGCESCAVSRASRSSRSTPDVPSTRSGCTSLTATSPAETLVAGEVDVGHAAAAEGPDQAVPAPEQAGRAAVVAHARAPGSEHGALGAAAGRRAAVLVLADDRTHPVGRLGRPGRGTGTPTLAARSSGVYATSAVRSWTSTAVPSSTPRASVARASSSTWTATSTTPSAVTRRASGDRLCCHMVVRRPADSSPRRPPTLLPPAAPAIAPVAAAAPTARPTPGMAVAATAAMVVTVAPITPPVAPPLTRPVAVPEAPSPLALTMWSTAGRISWSGPSRDSSPWGSKPASARASSASEASRKVG